MSHTSSKSEYDDLLYHYKTNSNTPWNEWLKFSHTFDKPGKQGLVGILEARKDS